MKKPRQAGRRNPVAKHAVKFNRAQIFRDRSKYRRHAKHKGKESWPVRTNNVLTGQSFLPELGGGNHADEGSKELVSWTVHFFSFRPPLKGVLNHACNQVKTTLTILIFMRDLFDVVKYSY